MPEYNRDEYAKTLDWNKLKCKNHKERKATIQFNPPIGAFLCTECYRELHMMRIHNMGCGF